jgi:hypothetical protein
MEKHHIVYGSEDIGDDTKKYQIHFYCRKNKKGNTSEYHPGEIVRLCHEHHLGITALNARLWRVNRYQPLSCHQRRNIWKLFLEGKTWEGVEQ